MRASLNPTPQWSSVEARAVPVGAVQSPDFAGVERIRWKPNVSNGRLLGRRLGTQEHTDQRRLAPDTRPIKHALEMRPQCIDADPE